MNWYFLSSLKQLFFSSSSHIHYYGRGIHDAPNPKEHELFDSSTVAFENGDFYHGYHYFLQSLQHLHTPHLTLKLHENNLEFILAQGAAIIHGHCDKEVFSATSIIANSSSLNVTIKRHLLERNFQLTYANFSQENGTISLKIHLNTQTITPQKIFFPLRELALNAAYEKEFIASEYGQSPLLEMEHVMPLEPQRLEYFYNIMMEWIDKTTQGLTGLLSNDNNGMASFSYLTLLLQIDYLLLPRKKIAKEINEKINSYFLDDEKLTLDKNNDLENYLVELKNIDFTFFCTQFYSAPITFSPYDQASHEEVATFIDESLGKVRWYKNNHINYVIPIIYHYISLYSLYNYGLHPSLRALFHLHVQIYLPDFFQHEEGKIPYISKTGVFQKSAIIDAIEAAIQPYTKRHKNLRNFGDQLNFSDLEHFSQSFYQQLKTLDYQEV